MGHAAQPGHLEEGPDMGIVGQVLRSGSVEPGMRRAQDVRGGGGRPAGDPFQDAVDLLGLCGRADHAQPPLLADQYDRGDVGAEVVTGGASHGVGDVWNGQGLAERGGDVEKLAGPVQRRRQ